MFIKNYFKHKNSEYDLLLFHRCESPLLTLDDGTQTVDVILHINVHVKNN